MAPLAALAALAPPEGAAATATSVAGVALLMGYAVDISRVMINQTNVSLQIFKRLVGDGGAGNKTTCYSGECTDGWVPCYASRANYPSLGAMLLLLLFILTPTNSYFILFFVIIYSLLELLNHLSASLPFK